MPCCTHHAHSFAVIVVGLHCDSFKSQLSRKFDGDVKKNFAEAAVSAVLVDCEHINHAYGSILLAWLDADSSHDDIARVEQRQVRPIIELLFVEKLRLITFEVVTQVIELPRKVRALIKHSAHVEVSKSFHVTLTKLN